MLSFLREKKDQWAIKIMLGMIILSFAAFFGASSLQKSNARPESPALVNDEPINAKKFDYLVQSQMDQLRQAFKGNLPANIEDSIRQSVLNSLIHSTLLNQDIKHQGYQTSLKKLTDEVIKSPQFQKDGRFDSTYYKTSYLPGYKLRLGTSFEIDMMQELARDEFLGFLESSYSATDSEAQILNKVNAHQFKFDVIDIALKTPNTPTEENSAPQLEDQTKLAQDLIDRWSKNQNIDKLLKDNNLKKESVGPVGYATLKNVLLGQSKTDDLKKLLDLSEKSPVAQEPFHIGSKLRLVRLIEKKSPAEETTAETLSQIKSKADEQWAIWLQTAYLKDLKSNAKIEQD